MKPFVYRLISAFMVFVAIGCTKTTTPIAVDAGPADGHVVRFGVSVAAFQGDVLIECDDIVVSKVVFKDVETAALHKAADAIWSSMKLPAKGTTATRLDRSCEEQFPDRPTFGVCSDMPMSAGVAGRVAHFSFANVFRSDWAVKECLNGKGSWTSMSRKSPDFFDAQLRFDQANVERRTRKLLKASGVDPAAAGLDN